MTFLHGKLDTGTNKLIRYLAWAIDIYILARIYVFFFTYLDSSLILKNTILTGGDTISWTALAHYLKNTLLPHFTLAGWDPGNFCGYPLFQFYFSLPFLLATLLSSVIPLTVALKIVTLLGSIGLPLVTYLAFKKMGYRFPLPAIASCLSLVFLFQTDYNMFGGNLLSTLAGEFCYSLSFMIFAYYLASLYTDVPNNKNLLKNALLLALIGLTHSFVLLVALLLPLFFFFDEKRLAATISYTLRLNILAFLLMGFWLLPFIASKKYMTPFYLIWVFDKRSGILLPSMFIFATAFICRAALVAVDNILKKNYATEKKGKILLIFSLLALGMPLGFFIWKFLWNQTSIMMSILFALPLLIFIVKYSFQCRGINLKSADTRHYNYFCFTTLIAMALYWNSHLLHIPDIRFIPVVIFMILFVSVDLIGYLLSFLQSLIQQKWNKDTLRKELTIFILLAGVTFSCLEGTLKLTRAVGRQARDSFKYNYAGYQALPFWEEFKKINEHLQGGYTDSRVAYEKSSRYNRYGSDRIFESLPYFSGRSTLEGVLFSSSSLAKPIMALQAEFSKEILAPVSYIFPRINISLLPGHFEMFNIGQIIAVSETLKNGLREHSDFSEEFQLGEISIFKYHGRLGYVSIPKNLPVIYNGPDWRETFYQWFKQPATNDIPIVPKTFVEKSPSKDVFFGEISSLAQLSAHRKPATDAIDPTKIVTQLKPFNITFSTPYLGIAHIVKVSYFPNWRVKGAKRIYPVAPGFMLVIPESHIVELYYSHRFFDWAGIFLTLGGILLLVFANFYRRRPFIKPPFVFTPILAKMLLKNQRQIICIALSILILSSIYCYWQRNRPVKIYRTGLKLFIEKRYEKAIEVFKEMLEKPEVDRVDRIFCILFSGRSYLALGKQAQAIDLFKSIIEEYPYSRYVAEAYYELGQIYRSQADYQKAIQMLEKAIYLDTYSNFANYAKLSLEEIKRTVKQP